MKKKVLSILVCAVITVAALTGCSNPAAETTNNQETGQTAASAEDDTTADAAADTAGESSAADDAATGGPVKIGVTIQSLNNQVWAATCANMQTNAEAAGNELTYMSCDDNSAKQIEQIENYISSGCDVIMVNPSDPNAIETVCKSAQDAGIKIMCWDNEMQNTDLNWLIDNEQLGYVIGEQAAQFINEKFDDGKCEVAVLNYPQTQILLERENGIVAALEELAPNAEIVAKQPALDANGGLTAMETILQANPNVKVVCAIGGGGAVGANEAFKANGEITDDIGVFAADATNEELAAIKGGEANRMSVLLSGTPKVLGDLVYNMLAKLGSPEGFTENDIAEGETMEGKNVYRSTFPITVENVDDYME